MVCGTFRRCRITGIRVWRQSHDLAVAVRRASRRFSAAEYSSLKSQMTRAAESVVFNIVEGCGAASSRDFARFLDIAIKSSREVESQLERAKDYGALEAAAWSHLTAEITSIRRQVHSLRLRVLAGAKD